MFVAFMGFVLLLYMLSTEQIELNADTPSQIIARLSEKMPGSEVTYLQVIFLLLALVSLAVLVQSVSR